MTTSAIDKTNTRVTPKLLREILKEIRLLRNELELTLPTDNLKDYARPEQIKKSYQKAIKQYPPHAGL